MKVKDLVTDNGHSWLVVETKHGDVTFTLNKDGSIYVLNTDGGALQDTEREFCAVATEDDWNELRALV